MCISRQLFCRAISKTTNLASHHSVPQRGAFCYFYKAGVSGAVELNLAIMFKKKKKKKHPLVSFMDSLLA